MYVLTREASQFIDAYVPTHMHMPLELLMENAGRGIADAIIQEEYPQIVHAPLGGIILFVCGVGNNGADGLVAARHLQEQGIPVVVATVGDGTKGSELFTHQLAIVKSLHIEVVDFYDFYDWSQTIAVVEGLAGTGFSGTMRENFIDVLHRIDLERTQYEFDLWAIDVPTGVDATTGAVDEHTIPCDYTITFGSIKEGLLLYPGKSAAGTVIVAPLGVAWQIALEEAPFDTHHFTLDEDVAKLVIHYRSDEAHKGINGSCCIIGGSKSMIGAPIMSADAAVHSGSGKVTVCVPQDVQQVVQSKIIPEVMVQSFSCDTTENPVIAHSSVLEGRHEDTRIANVGGAISIGQYDVVAIGPGLGRTEDVQTFVHSMLEARNGPIVLDADALYALGTIDDDLQFKHCIMTPHLGEFGRLIGKSTDFISKHYVELATEFAKAHNVVLVLKGIPSIVALPTGEVYINTLGNSGMGTGGMGDTLTGVITALVAQGYALQDAALLGVYVHSRSADILAETKPWGYTPSDVSANIGIVIQELLHR